MADDGLDLPRVTVRISNHFEGPNFVRGLAKQLADYTVLSDSRARLEFVGGFNDEITYVQILRGKDFGVDANGRFTGTVEGYRGFEKGSPENQWTFDGLDVPLDRLNTLVGDYGVTFKDLLLIPLVYDFIGAQFEDIYIAGSFDDYCRGFDGDDSFQGLSGDDTLIGDAGSDSLNGEDGVDRLLGGDDDDVLDGGRGGDAMAGGGGNDLLLGGSDSDVLRGGADNDTVDGGDGADALLGNSGDDRVIGRAGADSISGSDGDDTLLGGSGGDTIRGGLGADSIHGGDGTNFLYGRAGDDTVIGDGDTDELFGGTGDDVLVASTGADFVLGGAGNDTLTANTDGTGAGDKAVDSFIFEAAFGRDVVGDFEVGLDSIVLTGGIEAADVRTRVAGDDVIILVDDLGTQRITVLGVAATFDPAVDIIIGG